MVRLKAIQLSLIGEDLGRTTYVDLEAVRLAQLVLVLEQDELRTLDLDLDGEVVIAGGYASGRQLEASASRLFFVSACRWNRRSLDGGRSDGRAELVVNEEVGQQQNVVDIDTQAQEADRQVNLTSTEIDLVRAKFFNRIKKEKDKHIYFFVR